MSGTTAIDESGVVVSQGDIYNQTIYIIRKIEAALSKVDATLKDAVRTRIYVTNMNDWKKVAKAHGEFFGDINPASTLVQVSRLINQELGRN